MDNLTLSFKAIILTEIFRIAKPFLGSIGSKKNKIILLKPVYIVTDNSFSPVLCNQDQLIFRMLMPSGIRIGFFIKNK
ncbi:MAG: hypothetical protein LLG13_02950 [Bacteroidales bacterium]|nr:hypothetical protein [Bacteroidales bacterium]